MGRFSENDDGRGRYSDGGEEVVYDEFVEGFEVLVGTGWRADHVADRSARLVSGDVVFFGLLRCLNMGGF